MADLFKRELRLIHVEQGGWMGSTDAWPWRKEWYGGELRRAVRRRIRRRLRFRLTFSTRSGKVAGVMGSTNRF